MLILQFQKRELKLTVALVNEGRSEFESQCVCTVDHEEKATQSSSLVNTCFGVGHARDVDVLII